MANGSSPRNCGKPGTFELDCELEDLAEERRVGPVAPVEVAESGSGRRFNQGKPTPGSFTTESSRIVLPDRYNRRL